jgi:hypothetical protein
VSTYGDTPVVSGEDEVADEVCRGVVILRVRLPTSIVSCRGGGGRLEQARAARCFCRRMDAPFCSANEQMEVFRGSAVTREKVGRRRKARTYWGVLISSGNVRGYRRLRREIPPAWRHDLQGKEGGNGEEG